MSRNRIMIAAGIAVLAIAALGAGIAIANSTGDDDEAPIAGDALERASAAALAYTGEGRVTGTEAGDEESMYEVEVTLDDGTEVDVQLDQSFNVVSSEPDSANEGDDTGDD